jgi:hypothetical protein
MELTRRGFLRSLMAGAAVTAAGIYVPKVIYSFPSEQPMGLLGLVDDGTYVNTYHPVNLDAFGAMLKETYRKMVVDMLNSEPTFYAYRLRVMEPRPWG